MVLVSIGSIDALTPAQEHQRAAGQHHEWGIVRRQRSCGDSRWGNLTNADIVVGGTPFDENGPETLARCPRGSLIEDGRATGFAHRKRRSPGMSPRSFSFDCQDFGESRRP